MSENFKICLNESCGIEFNAQFSKFPNHCSRECQKTSSTTSVKKQSLKTPKNKCKVCKLPFEPKNVSTEPTCSNYDCRVAYAMQIVEKQKVSKEKLQKRQALKEKSELKEKLKTISDWNNELQKEINLIIRLIDKNHPCISSQRPLGKSYDAGHLFGRQSNPHIRYHLFNIFAQSVHDNQWKSGNTLEFVNGIELTFGTEIKDYCLSLKGLPSLKLTIDEIRVFIQRAREIIKHLKLDNKTYSIQERIDLRKEYTEYIGIY